MDTNAINGLLTILVPAASALITWGIKYGVEQYGSKVPRQVWPLVCTLAGVGADYIGTLVAGTPFSPLAGAGLGLMGVGFREIVKITPPKEPVVIEPTKVDIKP